MAISGTDLLEVPIPYKPSISGRSPEFLWPEIWYLHFRILNFFVGHRSYDQRPGFGYDDCPREKPGKFP
jgi:hypothetical protein